MPDPVSIRTRVINNVVSTLAAISPANGYVTTVRSVHRGVREYGKVPCPYSEVLAEDPEVFEELANGSLKRILPMRVVGNVKCEVGAGDGPSAELEKMLADHEKALRADRTRGGLAQTTEFKRVVLFDAEPGLPYAEFHLDLEVHYRTKSDDPFTAV